MGFSCITKIFRYGILAAIALAAAFLAALWLTANPAAAQRDGGDDVSLKSWDTDNLRYSTALNHFSARNFRVPYHRYGGYVSSVEAKACLRHIGSTVSLRSQTVHGVCPAGYSLITQVCAYNGYTEYGGFRENHRYVYYVNRPASYRAANSSGLCDPISYTPAVACYVPDGDWRTVCSQATYQLSVSGSLMSVSHVGLCWDSDIHILSLRRDANSCASAARVNQADHPACQSAVADAFFQTGGSTGAVNDFPVIDYDTDSASWAEKDGAGSRSAGCVAFAEQQDRLASSMSANGGWYLTAEGVLKKNSGEIPARAVSRPAAAYSTWANKGGSYYYLGRHNGYQESLNASGNYLASTSSLYDNRADPANGQLAVATGVPATGLFPWGTSSSPAGSGRAVPCTGTVARGCYDKAAYQARGRSDFLLTPAASRFAVAASANLKSYGGYGGRTGFGHLSHAQDAGGGWCPAGWHPRGQDSTYLIGGSTGRTLTSLNGLALSQVADAHWCRSDVRYTLKFIAQQHICSNSFFTFNCRAPTGVSVPDAGDDFGSYGRKNCYKTMTGYNIASAECEYVFPLPRCDSDGDGTADREFSAAEIANIGVEDEPLAVGEAADCGTNINPPDLAGFDADPCVTVRLSVSENLPAASDAQPGVFGDDRTVTGVAGHDLGAAAAFPNTAAPPRDLTAGSEDPSGCPDGEEERADHGSRSSPSDAVLPAASPQRRGSQASADPASPHSVPAPLPSSSSAANTAPPPSDYDADNSYAGVRANLAHRYASKIAENTCAAKRAEADLVMAVLQARRASFSKYLADYKNAADTNETKFGGYTAVNSGASGLSWYWARDTARERNRAADALETAYGNLSSALEDAKTAYDAATTQTQNLPGTSADDRARVVAASSPSGCVKHYDDEIARLKKIFLDAETAAFGTGADGISEEATAIATHQEKTWARPSVSTRTNSIRLYPANPQTSHTTRSSTEQYDCDEDGENCKTRTVTACSGYSFRRSGRVEGSYTPKSRSLNARGTFDETSGRAETRRSSFLTSYSAAAGTYRSTDTVQVCPPLRVVSGETQTQAETNMRGSIGTVLTVPLWPTLDRPVAATAIYTSATPAAFLLPPSQMLGRYHPGHTDRSDLDHSDQLERATAATRLGALTISNAAGRTPAAYAAAAVPAANPQSLTNAAALRTSVQTAATAYRQTYTDTYDRAHTRARQDMGGTGGTQQQARWSNFRWEYDTDSLKWENYTQNVTTDTTLADGTVIRGQAGYDLVSVDTDGKVTVAATRLDYETSSYGVGNVYAARPQPEQRECKIRRTRTPRLELAYEPPTTATARPWRTCPAVMTVSTLPCGTDSHSSRTGDYYDTAFQPNSRAEKFKLYPRKPATEPGEAEVLNLRVSISDSPPVFCSSNTPSATYVSHAAGAMNDISAAFTIGTLTRPNTTVLRPTGYSGAVTADHCFSGGFPDASAAPVKVAVFDDTAHSAMNLVYLERDSGIALLSSGAAFTASAVAYRGDAEQSTRFYGTYYSMPTSLGRSAGWDVISDPNTSLSSVSKNRIAARDKPATPNWPAVPVSQTFAHVSDMKFDIGFLDCRPDVENVVFIGNIANADQTAAESFSQRNGYSSITSSAGYPMDAPPWYYPPWHDIKGETRRSEAEEPGTTIAPGPVSEIYTHPQSSQYGWVINTVNNTGIDKQPISAFRNQPDVKRNDPNRPADVTLETHRQVCFGNNRTTLPHYRSTSAAADPLGHNTDSNPPQAMVIWTAHNPACTPQVYCQQWQTRCYLNANDPFNAEQTGCPAGTGTLQPADSTFAYPNGTVRYPDKALTDANIIRITNDSDLADTPAAAANLVSIVYKSRI